MPTARLQPLAGWSVVAAFLLIGGALFATVWATRASVQDARAEVRKGEALALGQLVRSDLLDLGAAPGADDCAAILADRQDEGLRYLGVYEGRNLIASAGDPLDTKPPLEAPHAIERGGQLEDLGARVRFELGPARRKRGPLGLLRLVVEVEPIKANALGQEANWAAAIGGIAAAALLGVAGVLVLRESRRRATEREREREKRLANLGEMSAVLAHEIRNPLASLKGNAQLLAQMLPEDGKPRAKANRVVEEAQRLEKLTADLLQFVRTGSIQRAPVDPAAIVRDAAAELDVTIDATAAPASFPLDAARVRQVAVNLLENAIAAGPPVTATVRADGAELVLEVADRGPGVPADQREKIFEPFFTGKTSGTGLGLAVARRVVELHGGSLAVYDNPGGGALFRATFRES
ncbi:MAG TPA: HAMP domain-containing sensor histidine kinase [Kofleriaceae bacterium]|jgi:two-component system sensor histidine kinase HydH